MLGMKRKSSDVNDRNMRIKLSVPVDSQSSYSPFGICNSIKRGVNSVLGTKRTAEEVGSLESHQAKRSMYRYDSKTRKWDVAKRLLSLLINPSLSTEQRLLKETADTSLVQMAKDKASSGEVSGWYQQPPPLLTY